MDNINKVSEFPLLMTASIDPRGMSRLSVSNVQVRAEQYFSVLDFYLKGNDIERIVFAENSQYNLGKFQALAAKYPQKSVEFLSCDLNNYPRQWGKSYGEMQILDYVLDQSILIRNVGGFFKVTGRFPVLNVGALRKEAEKRTPWGLFCDNKDHPCYDWLRLGWTGHACDTRFFGVTTEFYRKYFYGRSGELDDSKGHLIEFMFFETARRAAAEVPVVRRFHTEPEYAGKAGHIQSALLQVNDYSGSLAKTKRMIRQIGRKLVPWFWF